MLIEKLNSKKIRFFLLQSFDTGFFLFKEYYFWYLLNLMVEKLWFNLENINVEIVFPFNKYLDLCLEKLDFYNEDVFIFYLENPYHSYEYSYWFLLILLEKIKLKEKKPEIYIYTLKTSAEKSIEILEKYNFVKIVIRTDIEYFFNEYFYNNID